MCADMPHNRTFIMPNLFPKLPAYWAPRTADYEMLFKQLYARGIHWNNDTRSTSAWLSLAHDNLQNYYLYITENQTIGFESRTDRPHRRCTLMNSPQAFLDYVDRHRRSGA